LEPSELINRAVQRLGGEAKLAMLETVSWRGKLTITENGQEKKYGEFDGAWQGTDKQRLSGNLDLAGQKLSFLFISNGPQGWYRIFDNVDDMPPEMLATVKEGSYALYLSRILPSLKDRPFQLSIADEVDIGGRPAIGMMVRHPEHKDVKLFFDKESSLPVKSEIRLLNLEGKEALFEIHFRDYEDFHGLNCFHRITVTTEGKEYELRISELKPMPKLDKKLFMRP
jgi:hypothetical protein